VPTFTSAQLLNRDTERWRVWHNRRW